jgi:hypothetical protein
MAVTAADALTESKILLNDPSGNIYPDDRLIPIMQKAYRELQTKLMLHGLSVLKEHTVLAAIPVPIGTTALGDGSGLPPDIVYPIEISERPQGSTQLFVTMLEQAWEPEAKPGTSLVYWNWREEEIKFLGATSDREVRIKYMKGLGRITSASSPITVNNATTWLASRTAAIAAFVLGSNPTRADGLNGDAAQAMEDLLRYLVRRTQGLPVRRAVNRYRR